MLSECYTPLYKMAMSLTHDPMAAEDLTQTAMEKFLETNKNPKSVEAMLVTIIKNLWYNKVESESRRRELSVNFDVSDTCEMKFSDVNDYFGQELMECLSELPESTQELILGKFLFDMSYEEIAVKCGTTHQAAYGRIKRGLAKIKPRLREIARREGYIK